MTDILSFQIYRTESIEINRERFTVYLSKRTDIEAYELFAVNDSKSKSWRASYTSEVAFDFNQATNQSLADEIYKLFRSDVENNVL